MAFDRLANTRMAAYTLQLMIGQQLSIYVAWVDLIAESLGIQSSFTADYNFYL